MLKVTLIVILYLFGDLTFLSQRVRASQECNDLKSKSAMLRLKKYLLCEYDQDVGRKLDRDSRKTVVWLSIAPNIILFHDDSGNMELHGRLYISWVDAQLSWHPSSFGGLETLQLWSHDIWVPDITVRNSGGGISDEPALGSVPCSLQPNGWVECNPEIDYQIKCQTDFTMWPFDRQNCTLILASWSYKGDIIALSGKLISSLDMDSFHSNGEWSITVSRITFEDTTTLLKNGTSSMLSMDFIMDRAHNHLSGLFISPAIIMMVFTLTTIWLDPRSIESLVLACLNPMIHLLCLQTLNWSLPHNGITVPNILLFYIYSLILATLTLLITLFSSKIHDTKTSGPKWMTSLTKLILSSKAGQILLLNMLDPRAAAEIENDFDDTDNLVSSDSKKPAWGYAAILLSWISFIIFFIVYIGLYIVLIPNSSIRPPVEAGEIPFFYFTS